MDRLIGLKHGDGGKHTSNLIRELFYKYFYNELLINGYDSAVFQSKKGKLAFTTDSFVVKPLFFPGGDIGTLAIYGTVNDLAVSGANPLYLSTSFIIEEGFPYNKLSSIVKSMAKASQRANVRIVTGDTKVVEKGMVDGIFINTSGIGEIKNGYEARPINIGDKIIITGPIADHGTTIAIERYNINVKGNIRSDCRPINRITRTLIDKYGNKIKFMKDPTRGGLATALNEIAQYANLDIEIIEEAIPIKDEIKYVNELLGLDPLYLACEGRGIIVVENGMEEEILDTIQEFDSCRKASIIGNFVSKTQNIVFMETLIGGKRIINTLEGSMLPRIC